MRFDLLRNGKKYDTGSNGRIEALASPRVGYFDPLVNVREAGESVALVAYGDHVALRKRKGAEWLAGSVGSHDPVPAVARDVCDIT